MQAPGGVPPEGTEPHPWCLEGRSEPTGFSEDPREKGKQNAKTEWDSWLVEAGSELGEVCGVWDALPEALRSGILAMARAAQLGK